MTEPGPSGVSTDELFANKKVVMFAVPGAFAPTCTAAHLPGFVVNANAIKANGVDAIVCMSVDDPFVMTAWGQSQKADAIQMVADSGAELTKAMRLNFDLSGPGLGVRSKRFAAVVDEPI